MQTHIDGIPIINDDTREELCGDDVLVEGQPPCKGWMPRDYSTHPVGGLGFAAVSPEPIIPRFEWDERIRDRLKMGAMVSQTAKKRGIKPFYQDSTLYCWSNAVVKGGEILRVMSGQKHIPLSPASIAAPIKNYRNVGGWGTEAAEFMKRYGANSQKLWPANAIDSRLNTAAAKAERAQYRLDECYDMQPRNFDLLMSHILRFRLCPLGLNWWGHEILGTDPVILDGRGNYGIQILNSWGESWGTGGWGILDEQHATPDDVLALGTVIGS